jgi:hypothetical protein
MEQKYGLGGKHVKSLPVYCSVYKYVGLIEKVCEFEIDINSR